MTVEEQTTGAVFHLAIGWHDIDWQKAHREVRRLQVRIVKATQEGRWGKVKALQHLLTHSYSAKVLAVKRVTENDGKKSPGIDGEIWDTPQKKWQGAQTLQQRGYRPQPLRRIYIPKSSNPKKKRPLSIPTIKDRAMQALYLLALEPVAETTGDPHSYGFRKKRACCDAIEQCFKVLASPGRAQWILEGDIKACFDGIDHQWLIANIPMEKSMLKKVAASRVYGKRAVISYRSRNTTRWDRVSRTGEYDPGWIRTKTARKISGQYPLFQEGQSQSSAICG